MNAGTRSIGPMQIPPAMSYQLVADDGTYGDDPMEAVILRASRDCGADLLPFDEVCSAGLSHIVVCECSISVR